MANISLNIHLPADTWVDIYLASGIPVGTKIGVENIFKSPVILTESATEPLTSDPDSLNVCYQRQQKYNSEGSVGAFALSEGVAGAINVFEVTTK